MHVSIERVPGCLDKESAEFALVPDLLLSHLLNWYPAPRSDRRADFRSSSTWQSPLGEEKTSTRLLVDRRRRLSAG